MRSTVSITHLILAQSSVATDRINGLEREYCASAGWHDPISRVVNIAASDSEGPGFKIGPMSVILRFYTVCIQLSFSFPRTLQRLHWSLLILFQFWKQHIGQHLFKENIISDNSDSLHTFQSTSIYFTSILIMETLRPDKYYLLALRII
jgi:hypothetical protein